MTRSAKSVIACLGVTLAFMAPAREARADPFVYTTPAEPDYLRMSLQELGLFGLGLLQYQSTKSNEQDWDVRVDWPGVRSKLLWEASSFDDNKFDTNWLTHPAAGFLYYSTARGNRLGILPSFAVTTFMSAVWEELGEIKEQVAINDVVVTPVLGATARRERAPARCLPAPRTPDAPDRGVRVALRLRGRARTTRSTG